MTSGVIERIEPEARDEATRAALNGKPFSRGNLIEDWLQAHLDGVALAIVAAGFAARILAATKNYLNPDEALHYLILNQASAFQAYKASLTNAHPPLIYLVLYAWHFLGRSELMLRMPSVLAGTAFCWAAFRWIKIVFGGSAALIGVTACAFSPALIALSAEVRAYALFLFCLGAALYFLARAFEEKVEEKSVRYMWWFTGFLYLAILTHYSAVFFTVALGLYVLARIAGSQLPRRAALAWAAGQMGALAIYVFLYQTHVSKIKALIAAWAMPYDATYFHWGDGNIFVFTRDNTANVFLFLFGQRFIAGAMLLLFLAAVVFLLARDLTSRQGNAGSRRLGILFLMPFAAVWGASLAGIYPYVGSRHTVFLAPFAIAPASFLLAAISRQKLWAGLLLAALSMGVSNASPKIVETGVTPGSENIAFMSAAMNHLEQTISPGSLILVDYQSSLPMTYYLCGPKTILPSNTFQGEYFRFSCKGYSVVSLHVWKLKAESFPMQFKQMAQSQGLKPGDPVWVFQSGWGANLGAELPEQNSKFRCLAPKNFGKNTSVIPFVVGPDLSPSVPSPAC